VTGPYAAATVHPPRWDRVGWAPRNGRGHRLPRAVPVRPARRELNDACSNGSVACAVHAKGKTALDVAMRSPEPPPRRSRNNPTNSSTACARCCRARCCSLVSSLASSPSRSAVRVADPATNDHGCSAQHALKRLAWNHPWCEFPPAPYRGCTLGNRLCDESRRVGDCWTASTPARQGASLGLVPRPGRWSGRSCRASRSRRRGRPGATCWGW
jgi:hypothetical protein